MRLHSPHESFETKSCCSFFLCHQVQHWAERTLQKKQPAAAVASGESFIIFRFGDKFDAVSACKPWIIAIFHLLYFKVGLGRRTRTFRSKPFSITNSSWLGCAFVLVVVDPPNGPFLCTAQRTIASVFAGPILT
jgi:hypothetical protein